MLNPTDLEQLATQMRARGLHSSWNDLLEFSESVVGSLVDAYQALLRNPVSSGNILSANPGDPRVLLQEKLDKALVSLTSQEQVTKWESEALADNIPDNPRRNIDSVD
jgi:hypothetical protein